MLQNLIMGQNKTGHENTKTYETQPITVLKIYKLRENKQTTQATHRTNKLNWKNKR
jgi:hypothetical protein